MRQFIGMLGILGVVVCAGCTSTGNHELAGRVGQLESRVQALERAPVQPWPTAAVAPVAPATSQPVATTMAPTKRRIQRALQMAGYYNGAIDGKIGPRSRIAIKNFQRDHALKPDGIIGKRTWARLAVYLPSE